MEFIIRPSQYYFVERRQDAADRACCKEMEAAIKGGSLGLRGTQVTMDILAPIHAGYTRVPIVACPFCGEEIRTSVQ